jgi:signal transduction histidine kinase
MAKSRKPPSTTADPTRERRGDGPITAATVGGRLVASALAATDRADAAAGSVKRADYLAALSRRLSGSLEESSTRETIAQVALPDADAWAIVDLAASDGTPVRLAITHPDPAKQAIAKTLSIHWQPGDGDPIGLPAVRGTDRPIAITQDIEAVLAASAHSSENLALLHELGFCACLMVSIRTTGREADGAITFVGAHPRLRFLREEIDLAERIATASAHALRNARLFTAVNERRSAAEESNRARTVALGQVTHELRTPLNAIGGYAELLSAGIRGPINADQLKDLERIRWNQAHLLELITDILNFVRVDTRRMVYKLTDTALGAVAREVGEMIEPIFEGKGQRIIFDDACGADAAVAHADADRVRQIMINLMTNASKYSPSGAVTTVKCGEAPASAFVELADSGAGIPADQLEAIFEPFVQLPAGADSRSNGVGLGLAIARQLARGMGGDLTVQSQVGIGSRFTLSLPKPERDGRATDS